MLFVFLLNQQMQNAKEEGDADEKEEEMQTEMTLLPLERTRAQV